MLLSRAVAVAIALVVVVPLSSCAARGSIDDVIRILSQGEALADDALRTAQTAAKELADSDEAKLVCKVSAEVASANVDSWNPQSAQRALATRSATTEVGTKLRELVASAVANPETKSGIKGSIQALDAAFC
ncbi:MULTISPECIES: hypothetical protein [unclassified Cryobacterium]|uniref:hypothetical protein n=1 Tax=unclassified Cryobacterium TaxID=2649013 RepID=UPI0018CAABAB|nr:hypothetical protein [Cryobacterium sp. CAN_C3]